MKHSLTVLNDGYPVLPVVPDRLCNSRARDGTPIDVRVLNSQESNKSTSITASVSNVRSRLASEVDTFESGEDNVLGEVCLIG